MTLAQEFFTAICDGKLTKVPQYDKSAHSGKGDRVGSQQWKLVNGPAMPKVEVIIFEGWCVGFRQLSVSEVEAKWNAQSRTLKRHKLEHLQFVNNQLGHYDVLTNLFDALIHIDAEDTEYVYHWRLEQEAMLRKEKGPGMTDEEVICFVDAYYPAYELFSEKLRSGLFGDKMDHQLRLVVDKDRKVKQAIVM
jgi:D-glycerate 3-kinase